MKKILLWILVISWMCLIFYFSHQDSVESTNQSRGFIDKTNIIGNGNPLQDSCLENPMDRGAWQTTVHGVGVGYN